MRKDGGNYFGKPMNPVPKIIDLTTDEIDDKEDKEID
jgi:hypothetical protein